MASLPRLPLYRLELYHHYDTIQQYIPSDVNEHLYTVLRNIMVCLAAYHKLDMVAELGAARSLDDVYTFLRKYNTVDWETVFGSKGIIPDNGAQSGENVGFIDIYDQITDVYQAYPRSPEGGLSSQIIRASDIRSLQHYTGVNYDDEDHDNNGYQRLLDILKSGSLKAGTDRNDQFPGVYFYIDNGALSEYQQHRAKPSPDDVALIFSTALLKSPSWHTNAGLLYGRVDESSYDPTTFHKLLFAQAATVGELIFHHECPFDYLEMIVARDEEVDGIRSAVNTLPIRYPVLSVSEYEAGKYTRHLKHINAPLSFPYPPLSLAWYAVTSGSGNASLNTIKKTLLNYGISASEARKMCNQYPIESLVQYLEKLNVEGGPLTHPVVVHPPY